MQQISHSVVNCFLNMNISQELLDKLKCVRCKLYLSVGPVTDGGAGNFLCGRCYAGGSQVRIYEVLAENFIFPCRYKSFGCQDTMKWGSVTSHERTCPKKCYLCPIVPLGTCLWRGPMEDIVDHFKQSHNEEVTDQNLIEIRLFDNVEGCKLIEMKQNHYIFHVYFNREQKLLKLNILKLNIVKEQQYKLTLHSHDVSKKISLATNSMENFVSLNESMNHSNIKDENVVDLSVLKFLTNDNPTIFCEITLLQNEPKNRVNSEIFKLLECPVCNECLNPPIHQCQAGHSFCSNCFSKLKQCPLCHKELTNTRNYVLEDLVSQISQRCKNKDSGCTYSGRHEDVKKHEETCYWFKCPLEGSQNCTWDGHFEGLTEHCKKKHVYLPNESYGLVCCLTNTQPVFRLIYADGVFFKICRSSKGEEFSVVIQFVGPSDVAATYFYEFGFVGTDNNRTNLYIRSTCQSLTSDETAFNNCLKIPHSLLESFTVNNKLRCNIKVMKKQDSLKLSDNNITM